MATPASKRRRLGNAAETLHKPFKSPFRSAPSGPAGNVAAQHQSAHTTSHCKAVPSASRELIALRADIQTLTQAHRLATSARDTDLEVLRARWRLASRAAAEKLFAGTRDRVNRMGGVRAWREREREQKEFRNQWDREEMAAIQPHSHDEGGLSVLEELEGVTEREKSPTRGEEDDTFTMGMMLEALNIDAALIGYDKEAQCWVD